MKMKCSSERFLYFIDFPRRSYILVIKCTQEWLKYWLRFTPWLKVLAIIYYIESSSRNNSY